MLITEKMSICINTNKVRKRYEELGYFIPLERNVIIEINIKDLNKKSHKSVECECDICHKKNKTTYIAYNKSLDEHGYYSCSGKCSVLKIKRTCKDKYNDENYNNIDKNKKTCLKRYGVENVFQLDKIKNKSKVTLLKKHGVENPSQSNEIKNKKAETCFINYGVKSPAQNEEIKEKIKQTCIHKYGVENYTQTNEYLEKTKQTCLEKYGVENYRQTNEYVEKTKNTLKVKMFKNTDIYYQGSYEFDFLEKYYIIGVKKINSILYSFENKQHAYFPDFYYEPMNLIIEIKSDYFYDKYIEKNLAKEKYCIEQGYKFIFIINKNYEQFVKLIF
jgi:hypothetical protein